MWTPCRCAKALTSRSSSLVNGARCRKISASPSTPSPIANSICGSRSRIESAPAGEGGILLVAVYLDGNAFTDQRALDEHRLAVDARDAPAFLVERGDDDGIHDDSSQRRRRAKDSDRQTEDCTQCAHAASAHAR